MRDGQGHALEQAVRGRGRAGRKDSSARHRRGRVVDVRLATDEGDGGGVESNAFDALHPRSPAPPQAIDRRDDAGPLPRVDALEGPQIGASTPRPDLGHDEQGSLPGDHVELEMTEPEVSRDQVEPENEEIVCDRELSTTAELDPGHVPPVLLSGPQFWPFTPPQVVQVVTPEFESNAVPLLMQ